MTTRKKEKIGGKKKKNAVDRNALSTQIQASKNALA
jgi:hypothetical protein